MPELPEVETMRRGVLGIVGGVIHLVEQPACPRKPIAIHPGFDELRRRLLNRAILEVDRVGKRVVVRLDNADAIVIEPRMTGLLLVADPPDPLYLRLRIGLAGSATPDLWYWDRRGLGHVRLLSPAEFSEALGPEKLGPDALVITGGELQERLGASKRAVKVALLDQRAVAGIGNLYAAEILHMAGIHPAARCDRLRRRQWSAIADAAHAVLSEAIRYEGSTLGDGTYRNALSQNGGYQSRHQVYAREGKPCARCASPILRIVQAQRSTFYCGKCQTKRGARGAQPTTPAN